MKIVILGKHGMLGHITYQYFQEKFEVVGTDRETFDAKEFTMSRLQGRIGGIKQTALKDIRDADYVINCIGTIKPEINDSTDSVANAVLVNSLFPRYLADFCQEYNIKLIHITTDCVFSGKRENLNESAPHDAQDVYGKTKSLGEPTNCMVLRTSIIGPELKQKSLLEWFKQQKTCKGFTNHLWNGMTTLQLAKCIHQIITNNLYGFGLSHIFSDTLSKHALLSLLKKFNPSVEITPAEADPIYRDIKSTSPLVNQLHIPKLENQIEELYQWINHQ